MGKKRRTIPVSITPRIIFGPDDAPDLMRLLFMLHARSDKNDPLDHLVLYLIADSLGQQLGRPSSWAHDAVEHLYERGLV